MLSRKLFSAALLLVLGVAVFAGEAKWPQFRGLNGSGVAEKDAPPVKFGPGTNEVFKVATPAGLSSPVVWGERLFLTGLDGGKLVTLCYGAHDGKLLWRREAPFEKLEEFHQSEGSPAASTPATDGKRIYSFFGSAGVFAYTLEGEAVWEHPMQAVQHVGDFGTGTSPIVHGGLVFVNRDQLNGSHFLALHAETGKLAWKVERPDMMTSWTSPVIRQDGEREEVVLAGAQRIKGYDLKTGAERWEFAGLPNATCPVPLVSEGMVFFAGWSPTASDMNLGRFPAIVAKHDQNGDSRITRDEVKEGALMFIFSSFDLDSDGAITEPEWNVRTERLKQAVNQAFALKAGNGQLSDENLAWSYTRGLPYVPSSLIYRGNFYMVRDGGMVTCLEAKTGKPIYEQERIGALGSYYPSPVAADGRIYICSNDGKFTVFAGGEKPEVLWKAELGEKCMTTPAIAHDRLYVRSANYLWCFGEK